MKIKIQLVTLFAIVALSACKKSESTDPGTTPVVTTTTTTETATEGTITIADNTNNTVRYDDKVISTLSFTVDKTLVYIYPGSQQITLQSKEKDGIFNKYIVGLNMPMSIDKVGQKQNCVPATTPLVGINVYDNGALYPFSCMNGTYTIEAMDAHNITILFSAMDFKQSFITGFDASAKRFSTKSFRIKGTY